MVHLDGQIGPFRAFRKEEIAPHFVANLAQYVQNKCTLNKYISTIMS